jgi:hypothetical protein
MSQVRGASLFVITTGATVHQRDIPGVTGLFEPLFDGDGDLFGPTGQPLSAGTNRHAIFNQLGRLLGGITFYISNFSSYLMWAVKAHQDNQQFVVLSLCYDSIQSESNADELKTQKQHIEASGCSRNNQN